MPTKQATFDLIVTHLRRQGCKSVSAGACQYRGRDGRQCAAGCLIPEDRYQWAMEGRALAEDEYCLSLMEIEPPYGGSHKFNNWTDTEEPLVPTLPGAVLVELGHDLALCRQMQEVHDNVPPGIWELGFKWVADAFELEYNPPVVPAAV